MKTTFCLLSLLAIAVVGCAKPVKVDVNCNEHTQGFLCAISAVGGEGKNYNVCWDIDVACGDGQKLSANTCQDISGGGKATTVVPNAKFSGGACKVGKVSGISVANLKINAK